MRNAASCTFAERLRVLEAPPGVHTDCDRSHMYDRIYASSGSKIPKLCSNQLVEGSLDGSYVSSSTTIASDNVGKISNEYDVVSE